MKEKIIPFIKKYPKSILLAIIAFNLFSIAGSLNTEAKLNRIKLDCVEWYKGEITDKELLNKIKMKGDRIFNICSRISEM